MSFQDDVAAIAAEHGPHVAIEWMAQCFDDVIPGLGEPVRHFWGNFIRALIAASSGAVHELDYYTTEVTRVL